MRNKSSAGSKFHYFSGNFIKSWSILTISFEIPVSRVINKGISIPVLQVTKKSP
jgi:hypothetical protein